MSEILNARRQQKFATDSGTATHEKLRRIVIDDNWEHGDKDLIEKIKHSTCVTPAQAGVHCCAAVDPRLRGDDDITIKSFFTSAAMTEVPIAGFMAGKFISRRIDRMIRTDDGILFVDYKTDTDKTKFHDKYIAQIREYGVLLRAAYPGCTVRGFILWTHDFTLEEIK